MNLFPTPISPRPIPASAFEELSAKTGVATLVAITRIALLVINLFIALLAPLVSVNANASALPAKISFQRILDKYDVALGSVEAIIQDRQGYLWFGGENGLARFDGYDLRVMGQTDSEGKQVRDVSSMYVDSRGILWIQTSTGLIRYYPEQEKFLRYSNSSGSPLKLSSGSVRQMTELTSGELLLATGDGLTVINVEKNSTRLLFHEEGNTNSLQSDALSSVLIDSHGDVWIGGDRGVDRVHWASGEFTHYQSGNVITDSLSSNQVSSLEEDHKGDIWIGTTNGLNRLSPTTGKITQFLHDPNNPNSLAVNNVRRIVEDSQGILWIGTDQGGLNYFDAEHNQFRNFKFKASTSDSLSSNVVRAIFEDKSGDLWIGNYPTGVNYYNRAAATSNLYTTNPDDPHSLSYNSVVSLSADDQGNYWLGTDGGGLNYFDRKTDSFSHFRFDAANPNSISANAVISTLVDSDGLLWAGTWGGGLNRFEKKTGQFTRYNNVQPLKQGVTQSQSLYSLNIRVIKEDSFGNLWLGTQDAALCKLDRKTGVFTHYLPDANNPRSILFNIVYAMLEDSKGRFWIGTQSSLELMDREKGTFIHFQKDDADPDSLSSSKILSIYEDSKGRLWFGTPEGLNLLQKDSHSFRHYGVNEGFYDAVITSIVEGDDGQLWLGTANGISSLDPETGKIKNFYKNSGWLKGNLNPSASVRGRANELLFGGYNGLAILNLTNTAINKNAPPVVITDFKLVSDSIKINGSDGILNKAIDLTDQVTLSHQQNLFSFAFAALNFQDPAKNEYAYRLQGFDKEWHRVGNQRSATYTNIDPGEYTFQVIAANNDGVWNTEGKSIKIRILPPWWLSIWAYLLYVGAITGFISWILLLQRNKHMLIEQQNKKLIALDKIKDDFIANTSHELQTPLNGIIGLAESLIEGIGGEVNPVIQENLKMISASGKRLASLVNDILDFSKLKNKHIKIHAKPTDLYKLAGGVLEMCGHTIKNPNVQLINKINPKLTAVLADEMRLQQILYNLIGNAQKFTHSGSISIEARQVEQMVWINVTDTGIGIPEGSLKKIFDSFEQLEELRERSYIGTGLGLAVTKQLIGLHGGEIVVDSAEGKGSTFSFCLPATSDAPIASACDEATRYNAAGANDKTKESLTQKFSHMTAGAFHAGEKRVNESQTQSTPVVQTNAARRDLSAHIQNRILIVDDNPINQQVLINQLTLHKYPFDVAGDGPEAIKMVEEKGPFDLILLDVMMPHMSGYEVCAKLREKYAMEELSIIFLTAKNSPDDLESGFKLGANDFLTKPFSMGELSSRIKTQLQLLNNNRNLELLVDIRTQEVEVAHNELKTLDEIVGIINQEIRIGPLLSVILKQTTALFPDTSYVAYWKLDERLDSFSLCYVDHQNRQRASSEAIARHELETIFLNEEYQIAVDVYLQSDLELSEEDKILIGMPQTASHLSMAFRQQDIITGILILGAHHSYSAFHSMLTSNYERLRNHIDSALSKARLVEKLEQQCEELELMSLTDPLTGLKNRRFLTKYIEHDVSLLQRKYFKRHNQNDEPNNSSEDDFIFFIMDIDHFKHTNDSLGHAAGDRVLSDIRQILEPIFRTSDYRIRWGGEEFLIVARFCDREHAPMKAEQLRSAMEEFHFVIEEGKVVRKTCSIGYACYPFSKTEPKALSWTQVISLADMALYAVKKSQRNGWMGVTNNIATIEEGHFKSIMDNPNEALEHGHIAITTNLTSVTWS